MMRFAEPVCKYAVFGDAHEHASGSDDRGVDGSGKNEKANNHDENPDDDVQDIRAYTVHGESGDQVVAINRNTHRVRNEHHGQQGDDSRKDEAVDSDDDRCSLQILELGVLDLAVDLSESLLAAHGKDGMAEGHDDSEESEACRQFGSG